MITMTQIKSMIKEGCTDNTVASVVQEWANQKGYEITFGQARYAVRKIKGEVKNDEL